MKNCLIISVFFAAASCSTTDSQYQGPVMNGKCALEVFPPSVVLHPESYNIPNDTSNKENPLIRQGGTMVCRTF